ncbi:MAG TPA: phosphoribosyl-ATP diphosphatase [Roseomonas sp.]|jgi:phosphoribosyl-ATP pyrophosphohydrolase
MGKEVKKKNPAKLAAVKKSGTKKVAVKRQAVPLPESLGAAQAVLPKTVKRVETRYLAAIEAPVGVDAAILDRLWDTVESRRLAGDVKQSHSARLLARGTPKVAQKLGEEAVECVIEATLGNHKGTILESADLLYHLIVLWVDAGIQPAEVWSELARRQGISGIAEKASRPQGLMRAAGTRKLP